MAGFVQHLCMFGNRRMCVFINRNKDATCCWWRHTFGRRQFWLNWYL